MNDGANVTQSPEAQSVSTDQQSNVSSTISVSSNNEVKATETKTESPKTEEKVLKQSEVDKIVAHEKQKASEKAKREALEELQKDSLHLAQSQGSNVNHANTPPSANIDPREAARQEYIRIHQEAANLAQQRIDLDTANSFMQKIELAKQSNPDFEKNVFKTLKVESLPMPMINLLNSVDNVGDVLTEMADRPSAFTEIMNAFAWNPELARKTYYKLSSSIKANKDALNKPIAPAPLDQIKPSPTSKDNGKLTIADLRKLPQYRV